MIFVICVTRKKEKLVKRVQIGIFPCKKGHIANLAKPG
jgi:hypothetical protein